MSAHVEHPLPRWHTTAASVPTSGSERSQEDASGREQRSFLRGWTREERTFAIGSLIFAAAIPGFGGIVIAIANSTFGSGITP